MKYKSTCWRSACVVACTVQFYYKNVFGVCRVRRRVCGACGGVPAEVAGAVMAGLQDGVLSCDAARHVKPQSKKILNRSWTESAFREDCKIAAVLQGGLRRDSTLLRVVGRGRLHGLSLAVGFATAGLSKPVRAWSSQVVLNDTSHRQPVLWLLRPFIVC